MLELGQDRRRDVFLFDDDHLSLIDTTIDAVSKRGWADALVVRRRQDLRR